MPAYLPSLADVSKLAGHGGAMPVFRRLLADQLTPVSAFARIARGQPRAFLLESVVGGEHIARYSFVGAGPSLVFSARADRGRIEHASGRIEEIHPLADPLTILRERIAARAVPDAGPANGLPRFSGGAVGYASYDTIRYYERLPHAPHDDRGLDDLEFGIYDSLIIFDHVNKTILVVSHLSLSTTSLEQEYRRTCERIDGLVALLGQPGEIALADPALDAVPCNRFTSTMRRADFQSAVLRAKQYIAAGDIFQVVLSQRLRVESAADPFNIYRALRVVNPSPFMFYLKSPKCILVGASPEILCRVEDGVVTNRPLAGTRRRGATPAEDAALERELVADPKDRAEHIMLVDLGRNDVGRVAEAGSVRLSNLLSIERYSHVMHLSSNVTGRMASGRTAMDALRCTLPVGTVSGAPKIRAMQIIDELEPVRRGPYGGAVGYFDFSGNMDTCIALRTMVITPGENGRWTIDIQAGAGIVADSDPAAEYEETMNKARALLAAVAMAEGA